jgi:peptide/nickel transport system substrate-binding protein
MMDRKTLAETLAYGLVAPADTLVAPSDPVYRLLEQRGLTRYPFDLQRAQRLMGEAGWTRGADGVYRSAAGEPFTLEVRSTDKSDNARENQAIAAQLKEAGLISSTVLIPDAASSSIKAEMRSVFPGLLGWSLKDSLDSMQHLTSSQTPTEQNRWRGANYGAYSNPTLDRLFDSYAGALDLSARQGFLADVLKIDADDVASIHLNYDLATSVATFRKGLRGPGIVPPVQLANAWNIHTWELD